MAVRIFSLLFSFQSLFVPAPVALFYHLMAHVRVPYTAEMQDEATKKSKKRE